MFVELMFLALLQIDAWLLTEVGELLFGGNWQRELARALAPYRPDGQRYAQLDDSLVRKWKRRERAIPEWVGPALHQILSARLDQITTMHKRFNAACGDRHA